MTAVLGFLDPEALGWLAFATYIAACLLAYMLIERARRNGPDQPTYVQPGQTGPGYTCGNAEPAPSIPGHCRGRGHNMRKTTPTTWACANEGCPVTAEVTTVTVGVSPELAARLLAPESSEDFEAAVAEALAIANSPTLDEVLDAAVADFATELPDIEAFANRRDGRAS